MHHCVPSWLQDLRNLLACLPKMVPAAVTICLTVQVTMAVEQRLDFDCVQIQDVFSSYLCLWAYARLLLQDFMAGGGKGGIWRAQRMPAEPWHFGQYGYNQVLLPFPCHFMPCRLQD